MKRNEVHLDSDVFLDNISIDAVRGRWRRDESATNIKQTNIWIGTSMEEGDKENSNK